MKNALVYEKVVKLSPLVRRITQNNPGIMTGPGTNTYILGRRSLFIVDPGEDTDEHLAAILASVGETPVAAIAPTHAHPDHWPLAGRLARTLGANTLGFKSHCGYAPDRLVLDGETLEGEDWSVDALHTPGHMSDHVSYFLREEKALFSGDNVMAWSTSVIAAPDGNLTSYLASLDRLRSLETTVLYPAHGQPIQDARGRIEELIEHRKMRTAQILVALRQGVNTVPALVERIYSDVDPRLHPAARQSVLSHLEALLECGLVRIERLGRNTLDNVYSS